MTAPSGSTYIIASAFAFSVMTLLVKVVGQRIPSQEIVFARAIVSLILSYGLLRRAGVGLWGEARGLLAVRGVCGFLALSCVYYSVTHLPLAEATVIQYLYPIFTGFLAALILRERLSLQMLVVMVIGLCGVILVAKPPLIFTDASSSLDSFTVGVALCGALLSGSAYVIVRRLSATEHPLVIVFYFPLITVPASFPSVWMNPVMPHGWEWLLLLGVGITTQAGQVWLTRGLVRLPASRATVISYLQVVFATLWGLIFFAETPDRLAFIGSLMIVSGALVTAAKRR